MAELLIELFSEEIPARMQARAADDLCAMLLKALAPLMTDAPKPLYGPRRIAAIGQMAPRAETPGKEERGPRIGAPDAALDGFLRKHGATRDALREDGQFWVLAKPGAVIEAAALLRSALPPLLRGFPWPKSMRWGNSSFAWVRPLQRILVVLDGAAVPVALADGDDSVHGLVAADLTEGHRLMAGTDPFAVRDAAGYVAGLRARHVIADPAERERLIEDGVAALAAAEGLEVVPDRGLLAEVAGLVEWPVPLLGRIDDAFMDLPPEVMRTTMRVNQRYFALRYPDGRAAPRFGLVANIAAKDGGAAIIAGNERVLRARLADARFFWDQDRRQRLEEFLPKLESVVFHAKLGTQGARVRRLETLAGLIAERLGADVGVARRAALLAKADLASGMVGEFPELQGVMGRYYALHQGETPAVAEAIGTQYRPLGPGDAVPTEPVAVAVALADKLDQLSGFFAVGEKPTGSGDPFALRRAALGVIRIIRENRLRLPLRRLLQSHFDGSWTTSTSLEGTIVLAIATVRFGGLKEAVAELAKVTGSQPDLRKLPLPQMQIAPVDDDILAFLFDRLRVQLRAEGARHDVVAAVFGAAADDDLVRLLARARAVEDLLGTQEGAALLSAYRRAANILRIEERKDKATYTGAVDATRLAVPQEQALATGLDAALPAFAAQITAEDFAGACRDLARLQPLVDAFFDQVTVNDPDPELRVNRLRLLARFRAAIDTVADLSQLEG